MPDAFHDRRTHRSDDQAQSLESLMDYTKIYGGFEHTILVNEGRIVASSNNMTHAERLHSVHSILNATGDALSKTLRLPIFETIIAQTSRGESIACYFFEDHNEKPSAIVALSKTHIPPNADRIFDRTAKGYKRIVRTTEATKTAP